MGVAHQALHKLVTFAHEHTPSNRQVSVKPGVPEASPYGSTFTLTNPDLRLLEIGFSFRHGLQQHQLSSQACPLKKRWSGSLGGGFKQQDTNHMQRCRWRNSFIQLHGRCAGLMTAH